MKRIIKKNEGGIRDDYLEPITCEDFEELEKELKIGEKDLEES